MAMDDFLFIAYIFVFIIQIVLFVNTVRKPTKRKWVIFYLFNVVSIITSFSVGVYYDSLPVPESGFMPGLGYFGEVFISLFAALVYAVILIVSAILGIIMRLIRRRKKKSELYNN